MLLACPRSSRENYRRGVSSDANVMTLHDLRLDLDGRVAQIDHLLINRLFEVWVCESKSFTGRVSVNQHGEWSVYYGGQPRGIDSPIEQNRRHVAVLNDLFARGHVTLPKRLGLTLTPEVRSLVLLSKKTSLERPLGFTRVDGMETVIKVDSSHEL